MSKLTRSAATLIVCALVLPAAGCASNKAKGLPPPPDPSTRPPSKPTVLPPKRATSADKTIRPRERGRQGRRGRRR